MHDLADATELSRWAFFRANAARGRPVRTWASADAGLAVVPRGETVMLVGVGDPDRLGDLLAAVDPGHRAGGGARRGAHRTGPAGPGAPVPGPRLPRPGAHPGDVDVSWWGYLDAGTLAGVVGAVPPGPAPGCGVNLQALGVLPGHRRRGVAAAMTAA